MIIGVKRIVLPVLIIFGFVFSLLLASNTNINMNTEDIQTAVDMFFSRKSMTNGLSIMLEVPDQQLIPILTEKAMHYSNRSDSVYPYLINLLRKKNATQYQSGIDYIFWRVESNRYCDIQCFQLLGGAGDEYKNQISQRLISLLQDHKYGPNIISYSLDVIGAFKRQSASVIPEIRNLADDNNLPYFKIGSSSLTNKRNTSKLTNIDSLSLRVKAYEAWAQIAGLNDFLNEVELSDSVSYIGSLFAISRVLHKPMNEWSHLTNYQQDKIRDIVFTPLNSNSLSAMETAINFGPAIISIWKTNSNDSLAMVSYDSIISKLDSLSRQTSNRIIKTKAIDSYDKLIGKSSESGY